MSSIARDLADVEKLLKGLHERKSQLLATLSAFEKRGELMNEIYRLTAETKRVDVTRCSVLGGNFIDYDDSRAGWQYEVCFDYVLDGGETFRVSMTDTRGVVMDTSPGSTYVPIDPDNPNHHPAATVFYKLLRGDARNYTELDRAYFPAGDSSWEGSCIDKYWSSPSSPAVRTFEPCRPQSPSSPAVRVTPLQLCGAAAVGALGVVIASNFSGGYRK